MTISKTEQIALERALALLNAAKAKYKIILPDGTEYGELVIQPPKITRKPRHPRGELAAYFRPILDGIKPGEVRTVPAGKYGAAHLRSSLSGWCTARWGNGNAITSVDKANNTVEVMRVA